jgi:hypothetical protein
LASSLLALLHAVEKKMLVDQSSLMLIVTGAYAIFAIAGVAYLAGRGRPETRFTLVVVLLLLSALFALLPLTGMRSDMSRGFTSSE